jgi:ABC-type multidrug transport system fused ATPase/permease subunit
MAYLLRTLLIVMLIAIGITVSSAFGWVSLSFHHIELAIPSFLLVIFIQAFVMFYFIGISRLVTNVWNALHSEGNLEELFEQPPSDLAPYIKKTRNFVHQSTVCKRQTIPWTMLMLILGMIGFLLGGAHDTGMVSKIIHSGVIYGFIAAMLIGLVRQWYYLGKSHRLLREIKTLYQMPDAQM